MSGGAKGAFDASGYERAAKAIREINQSPHAGDALRLAQEQERTKQMQTGQKKSEVSPPLPARQPVPFRCLLPSSVA